MKKIFINDQSEALVSDEDYDRISKYQWHIAHGYAVRGIYIKGKGNRHVGMHSEVLKPKPGLVIDHIDHNQLNNQRDNLRYATHSQNMRNSRIKGPNKSGYKGVSWLQRDSRWTVWIFIEGRNRYIGSFHDVLQAAHAYNVKAIEIYGEFAYLNPLPLSFQPSEATTSKSRSDSKRVYRGIKPRKKRGLWDAQVICNGDKYIVGPFDSQEEAAYVYDQVALQVFGIKAKLNFL